jgi:hypothetical protein
MFFIMAERKERELYGDLRAKYISTTLSTDVAVNI